MSTVRATQARLARAELKRLLKTGGLPLEDALADPAAQRMAVVDVVAMLPYRRVEQPTARSPKPARHAAWRVCGIANVPPGVRVEGLSERQRDRLVAAYAEYHPC